MPPKKNPNRPKGKMTGYSFFVNACRLEHQNQFPGQKIKLAEFSTVCAKRWKEMTVDQKKPFAEMAERDKVRYENELKLMYPNESQPKRRRKKKDPNAPKKNLSPFFIFSKVRRPEIMKQHPNKNVGDISKVLSLYWSDMDEKAKLPFIKMSEEDKIRYQKQMEIYKQDGGVQDYSMVTNQEENMVDDDIEDDDEEEEQAECETLPNIMQPLNADASQPDQQLNVQNENQSSSSTITQTTQQLPTMGYPQNALSAMSQATNLAMAASGLSQSNLSKQSCAATLPQPSTVAQNHSVKKETEGVLNLAETSSENHMAALNFQAATVSVASAPILATKGLMQQPVNMSVNNSAVLSSEDLQMDKSLKNTTTVAPVAHDLSVNNISTMCEVNSVENPSLSTIANSE